ncbi:MAG: DUF2807 domain-containing protein [Alphaproteobacteria bacterium]|nr:DUF2807 domain-containing protein [Alphaproteobacteria bacterium]MBV9905445.1 DUF2807 domain-containing protein [Alphaproteobacteria bacterium]
MIRTATLAALATLLLAGTAQAGETVSVPHFNAIGLNGGGHVRIKYGATQSVTILKGSTQYTEIRVDRGTSLHINACNDSCPHNYDLEIEIVTPDLRSVALNGGGEIETVGSFPSQDHLSVAVNGGGDMDVRSVTAESVSAAVNGGGDITVTATKSLSAAVRGGGDITYFGNPSVSSAVQGGGDIRKAS